MPHVLVVDDDPDIRDIIALKLRRRGYSVQEAADGVEALASVARSCPDVVVTDWSMPRMDGLELCARLRASDRATPILMVTARTTADDERRCLAAGASRFLGKPFSPAGLADVVGELLATAG